MFYLQLGMQFVIIVIVVDDMKFVSNSTAMNSWLKQKISSSFDVKLLGRLQTLTGWEIGYQENGIKVS